MTNALLAVGIYRVTEDARLFAELKAYDAGLQLLHDRFAELLRERFVSTAQADGLELRERLYGMLPCTGTVQERRERLLLRGATNTDAVSKATFLQALRAQGITAQVHESPGTQTVEVTVTQVQGDRTREELARVIVALLPAHLNCSVIFTNGV